MRQLKRLVKVTLRPCVDAGFVSEEDWETLRATEDLAVFEEKLLAVDRCIPGCFRQLYPSQNEFWKMLVEAARNNRLADIPDAFWENPGKDLHTALS